MEFAYEHEAMKNEEIPNGLSMSEEKLFVSLRNLYQQYFAGNIEREKASRDKIKLLRCCEIEKEQDRLRDLTAQLWKHIEPYAIAYRKNKTIENADRFINAVYGLDKNGD